MPETREIHYYVYGEHFKSTMTFMQYMGFIYYIYAYYLNVLNYEVFLLSDLIDIYKRQKDKIPIAIDYRQSFPHGYPTEFRNKTQVSGPYIYQVTTQDKVVTYPGLTKEHYQGMRLGEKVLKVPVEQLGKTSRIEN